VKRQVSETNGVDPNDWMGEPDEPLTGFSWRGGTKKDTLGISFWPDVFLYECPHRGNMGIILMDTQGLFDNDTSPQDNARIFSLSILMSSTQIFNLTDLIQEDQLQYLQFATEYARFTSSSKSGTPFQHLIFLIRDWQNKDEWEFGWNGGQAFLNEVLRIKNIHDQSSKDLRDYIGRSFQKINCFLMPHPGFQVFAKNFDGRLTMIDNDFKEQLQSFVPELLDPEKLTVKGMYLRPMRASELYRNICSYINLFKSDTLPEPKNIYETMLITQLTCVVENCLNQYRVQVNESEPLINTEAGMTQLHEDALSKAIQQYLDYPKMGDTEDEIKFRDILMDKINSDHEVWRRGTIERLKREEAERLREEEAKRYAEALQAEISRRRELENEQRFPVRIMRDCQYQLMNPCNLTMAVGVAIVLLIAIL
jgi:atlastin